MLRGTPQKVVAAELNVSAPTLAGMLRRALAAMGVNARVSRVPIALPLLAHTAAQAPLLAIGEAAQVPPRGLLIRVTASLPTETLTELSASERVVMLRYLTGQSHVEIATARAVSPRTIANQLALSFEKLGASRRFELLRNLSERSRSSSARPAAALSPNESHALALRAQGLAYKVIAYELGIGSPAAFNLTEQGMKKLGIASEAELPLFFRSHVAAAVAKEG